MLSTSGLGGASINCDGEWFTPGPPAPLNVTRGFSTPVNFIGNMDQIVQLTAIGITDMNIQFVNMCGSADAVGAPAGSYGALGYSFYFKTCSKFAVRGSKFLRGGIGVMLHASTDADIQYNTVALHSDDGIRAQVGCNRLTIDNNRITDVMGQGRIYYDPVNGGRPYFWRAQGGTYTFSDVSHADAISAYNGQFNMLRIRNNIIEKYWGQGLWLPDPTNTFNGLDISGNDIEVTSAYVIAVGSNNANMQVSSNTVRMHPLPNPTLGRYTIALLTDGGTVGWYTDGQNVLPGTLVVNGSGNLPLTAMSLSSGIANGPGGAPVITSAPDFTPTPVDIPRLNIQRVTRPDYTIHSGLPTPNPRSAPVVLGPGGALQAYALNSYLVVKPGAVEGYYTDIENTYKTRWRIGDTVVRASVTGPVGMGYQATTRGSLTPDIDYGDGVWRAGNTVAIS